MSQDPAGSPELPAGGIYGRVVALAGLLQAAWLVDRAAFTGTVDDPAAYAASIESLFRFDAASPVEVFGGLAGLRAGLEQVEVRLGGQGGARDHVAGYLTALLKLERTLAKRPDLLGRIRTELEATPAGEPRGPDLEERIAALYQETVSTLSPRIMVSGLPEHLRDALTASRIRALLLAGLRAAVLWRQLGGTRLGLMLSRRALAGAARRLLDSAHPETDGH